MATKVAAYAAQSATSDIAPFEIERRAPRDDDVTIAISHCGVCHSDLHTARNDWGFTSYPVVPGHEVLGKVTAVGPAVTKFKVGDSVGVGCMVDSCRKCGSCHDGLEQYCSGGFVGTYNGKDKHTGAPTYGGYSESIVTSERFVLRIAEGVDPARTAPLLCAGITMWSPLKHWKCGPGKKVAIVGLGGLGHMGLKFAAALGADCVTLFTRSPGKEADAKAFGATEVIVSTDPAQMATVAGKFDVIIDTVPIKHDLEPYVKSLAINGTLVIVGLVGPIEPTLNTVPMIFGRRSVAGSLIGGVPETQEMLDFAAKHGIGCDVEVIKMAQINEAYERLLKADVKYRFVIDNATIKA